MHDVSICLIKRKKPYGARPQSTVRRTVYEYSNRSYLPFARRRRTRATADGDSGRTAVAVLVQPRPTHYPWAWPYARDASRSRSGRVPLVPKLELHTPTRHKAHESVDCKRLAAARLSRPSCALVCTDSVYSALLPVQSWKGAVAHRQKKLWRGGRFAEAPTLPLSPLAFGQGVASAIACAERARSLCARGGRAGRRRGELHAMPRHLVVLGEGAG